MEIRNHEEALGRWRPSLKSVAVGPGGDYAIGGGARDAVWIRDGEERRLEHLGSVTCLAFARDGRLASGSTDMGVRIHDAQRTRLLRGHFHQIKGLGWSASGVLASASLDGSVRVHAEEGSRTLRRELGGVHALAWRGEELLVAAAEHVYLLGLDGEVRARFEVPRATALRVAPTGAFAICWRTSPRRDELLEHVRVHEADGSVRTEAEARCVAFDDLGRHALSEGSSLRYRDVRVRVHDAPILALAWTGEAFLTGGADGWARLVGTDGQVRGGVRHGAEVSFVAGDGGQLISVSRDAVVRRWRAGDARPASFAPRLEPAFVLSDAATNSAAFSPDGSRVAVSTSEGVYVHALPGGERLAHLPSAGDPATWEVRFTSEVIAARAREGHFTNVWDADSYAQRPPIDARQFRIEHGVVLTQDAETICYRLKDGEELYRGERVRQLALIEGRALFPGGGGTLVDLTNGATRSLGIDGLVRTSLDPRGELAVVAGPDAVVLVDLAADRRRDLGRFELWSITWADDGEHFLLGTSSGDIRGYTREGDLRGVLEHDGGRRFRRPVFVGGERYAVGGQHGAEAGVYDVEGGQTARFAPQAFLDVERLAGRLLTRSKVSPTEDFTMRLYDLDGALVAACLGHRGPRWWQVNASPDGERFVSVVWGDLVRVWDLDGGLCIVPLTEETRAAEVGAVVDGRRFLVTGDAEGAKLWDVGG